MWWELDAVEISKLLLVVYQRLSHAGGCWSETKYPKLSKSWIFGKSSDDPFLCEKKSQRTRSNKERRDGFRKKKMNSLKWTFRWISVLTAIGQQKKARKGRDSYGREPSERDSQL